MKYKSILFWFFPILLTLITYKVQKTHYNWDVVFYCGAIFNDTAKPETSRKQMITAFEKSPYIDYKREIIPKTQYGKDVFTNDQSYKEQFAFYDIRIIYIHTIKLFHSFGIDAVYSVYFASLFYALAGVLAIYFFCFFISRNSFFSFVVSLFTILRPDFKEFITSSPDTLSAFSILLVILAYFLQRKWLMYISVIFCIISRTYNIIFVGLLYGLALIKNIIFKENIKTPIICISISVLVFMIINHIFHNSGYRVLYYHTFIEHLSFPQTQPKTLSYAEITKRLVPELPFFIYPLMYFMIVMIVAKINYKILLSDSALLVALVSIVTFVVKFCLFPANMPRFTFQYEMIGIILVIYYFRKPLYYFFNPLKKQDEDWFL